MTTAEMPEVLSSQELVRSSYLRITRDAVRFPDGTEAERTVVWHPGAVALVVEDEDGRWLLVEQYRHPAGRTLLEIPAGTREEGEAPEATAAREVREETGYAAEHLEWLGGAWMAPGFSSEFIDFYLATGLRHDPLPQDHDEFIAPPRRLTVDELRAAMVSGEIQDSKTMTALTLYANRQQRGRDDA
ncbi:MAG: NUDIX hydrolase [Chloroflexota bacterium]